MFLCKKTSQELFLLVRLSSDAANSFKEVFSLFFISKHISRSKKSHAERVSLR